MSARLVSRDTIAGEVAVPWIALREIRKEVATGAGGWWWLGLRWWGGGGVRSGWWLGNGLKRVSSVIAQPSQWGSYFLFSVSVSPDAGTAHVGTRSFLAPGGGGGNTEAEKQLSLVWVPWLHIMPFLSWQVSAPTKPTNAILSRREEGAPTRFCKNLQFCNNSHRFLPLLGASICELMYPHNIPRR